jgi:hypothetical protein
MTLGPRPLAVASALCIDPLQRVTCLRLAFQRRKANSARRPQLARTKWIPGILGDWDVSPDGKYVALPNHDSHDARIRMLALEPGPSEPREREVALAGLTNIRGLVWAAGGRGWFVSVDTTVGNRLLYVYLDGQFTRLGDIQGWAVPSPDGRRVAFLDRIIAANAWIIDRR